jgi:hypothetical protein
LSLGIRFPKAFHRLDRLNVERRPPWRFSSIDEKDLFSACAMPTLVFTKHERNDPVPAIPIPVELTAERTGDKFRYAQRQAIDMHLRVWPTILIFPDRGPEGRQMRIGLEPVAV